jgi:hypothetical protein
MPDFAFERELDRMFAEAPAFADADLFAARVDDRLDRGWTFRRLLIGGFGVMGGVIGGGQIIGSGLGARMAALSSEAHKLLTRRITDFLPDDLGLPDIPLNIEVLVMIGILAAVALALGLVRFIREI